MWGSDSFGTVQPANFRPWNWNPFGCEFRVGLWGHYARSPIYNLYCSRIACLLRYLGFEVQGSDFGLGWGSRLGGLRVWGLGF